MSLLIVGSIAFDTIITPYEKREKIIGGSGTYCALAASFFTRPRLSGVVGEDFPQEIIDFFKKKGIKTEGIAVKPGKTFFWEGKYGYDPNQRETLRTELNVMAGFEPILPPSYQRSSILYLATIDPDWHETIFQQMKQPCLVAMDTIQFWVINKTESIWRTLTKVNIFFANEEEIRLLTRETNLVKAAKLVLEAGPSIVVVKKGEHGALVFGRDFIFGTLAHPCENVVDPTGAGDSFAGGFLGYLDRAKRFNQRVIKKALVAGSAVASFVIEDFGIERLKYLTFDEIKRRMRYFRQLVSF
ncbi:MAG: PfkB family carbohydrate kinase [Candidatus Aminicenantes bacterium]|nr:PfkB family carbohydrate kinase [Candidatus Aminicenantes bacterium]